MDNTTNTSTSDTLRTAKWYESGLMLYWGDIERLRALTTELINAASPSLIVTSKSIGESDDVIARARLLLKELGQR